MSLTPKWRFERRLIEDAPEFKGVYVLWDGDTALAVGHALGNADTIRSRLFAHLSHAEAPGMANISHYSWEICIDPRKREAELSRTLGLQAATSESSQADDR
jgi:hypothetical protein